MLVSSCKYFHIFYDFSESLTAKSQVCLSLKRILWAVIQVWLRSSLHSERQNVSISNCAFSEEMETCNVSHTETENLWAFRLKNAYYWL